MSAQPSQPQPNSGQTGSPQPDTRLFSPGTGILVVLLCIGGAAWGMYRFFENAPAEPLIPVTRWYICSETGKPFQHTLRGGDKTMPVQSPHSNKPTGFPAEVCYCEKTPDGKPAPTYVLMNTYVGKPEPTHCPKCGAVVVMHNPIRGAASTAASASAPAATDAAAP